MRCRYYLSSKNLQRVSILSGAVLFSNCKDGTKLFRGKKSTKSNQICKFAQLTVCWSPGFPGRVVWVWYWCSGRFFSRYLAKLGVSHSSVRLGWSGRMNYPGLLEGPKHTKHSPAQCSLWPQTKNKNILTSHQILETCQ